ncbi:unnamed protein product [Sphagnum jensenii]|uniref:Uncharacterized protein n=1 Tax=Sphagnum jensenii TaxID=128206 RepID=A0ABP1B4I8_9BRYO
MIVQKYGNVDADDIRVKLDAIKQEPRERVQKYFERLDRLFQRGRITDAKQRRRRRQLMEFQPAGSGPLAGVTEEGTVTNREHSVRCGPGANVEILPLTMVNLIQKADSGVEACNNEGWMERASEESGAGNVSSTWCEDGIDQQKCAPESGSEFDSGEDDDEGAQLEGQVESESEFGDTELEKLVQLEGLQQILQLTLHNQADEFMREEVTDADDYADWIRWSADGEVRKKGRSLTTDSSKESVLLQIQWMGTMAPADTMTGQSMDGLEEDIRNPVGLPEDDDDFGREIQDFRLEPRSSFEVTKGILSVQNGREYEWFGLRRKVNGLRQHHECCFDINHRRWLGMPQICMLEALTDTSQGEDELPEDEDGLTVERETRRSARTRQGQRMRKLVLMAQATLMFGRTQCVWDY